MSNTQSLNTLYTYFFRCNIEQFDLWYTFVHLPVENICLSHGHITGQMTRWYLETTSAVYQTVACNGQNFEDLNHSNLKAQNATTGFLFVLSSLPVLYTYTSSGLWFKFYVYSVVCFDLLLLAFGIFASRMIINKWVNPSLADFHTSNLNAILVVKQIHTTLPIPNWWQFPHSFHYR